MVQLMSLFLELVSAILFLATKPFSLFKQLSIFGVKIICIVIQTWIELLRAAIWLHVHMFWSIVVWTVALISLPSRILNVLQRERLVSFGFLFCNIYFTVACIQGRQNGPTLLFFLF